jgi:hypothetical protein
MNEIYIAPWNETRWLVLSSFFFLFPSIYAYLNNLYFFGNLLCITSFISANYWRKATYSWRRTMDLIFAKISFVTFVINGVLYVSNMYYLIVGYIGLFILSYCYYLSAKELELKKNNWYQYHVVFHFIMMYEQFLIIDSIVKII